MSLLAAHITAAGSFAALPAVESDGGSLIKLIVALAVFVGPAIFKAVAESRQKKKALADAARRSLESGPTPAEERAPTREEAEGASWDELMRGDESALPPPPAQAGPPPLPAPAQRRRVLTEAPPLTEEPALDSAPPLTGYRREEIALPHASYENAPSYDQMRSGRDEARVERDDLRSEPARLGSAFEQFAPQEGLASDRQGAAARQVGATAAFTGGTAFQDLGAGPTIGKLEEHEIGAEHTRAPAARARARLGRRRSEWGWSVVNAEILGPPLALRPQDSGPTRPLGWS